MEVLELLAQDRTSGSPAANLPRAISLLRRKLADLRRGGVPLQELVVSQRLSRNLEEYRLPSPSARAAAQLQAAGKSLRAGQRVRFIYTLGEPGVYAWDLPEPPNPATLDLKRYAVLLLRAAGSVFEPFGVSAEDLAGVKALRFAPLKPELSRPVRVSLKINKAIAAGLESSLTLQS